MAPLFIKMLRAGGHWQILLGLNMAPISLPWGVRDYRRHARLLRQSVRCDYPLQQKTAWLAEALIVIFSCLYGLRWEQLSTDKGGPGCGLD